MKISLCADVVAILLFLSMAPTVEAELSIEVVFSSNESETIRAYFRANNHLPGYAKHKKGAKSLPPGIAKNLRRGKALPPGIEKRALPEKLAVGLPPVRDGYARVIVDRNVVLIEIATERIHDVLVDVISR